QVPDGDYTVVLGATTADGQQTQGTIPIVIDRTVSAFAASPAVFSPNGDGVQDVLGLTFTLAQPATVRLAVTRGSTEMAVVGEGPYATGPATLSWPGTAAGNLRQLRVGY